MMTSWPEIHETLRYDEVEEALGLHVTSRSQNGEHTAHCPLLSHGGPDRNPSFSLNIKKGVYGCFSCQGGGRTPELVRDIFGYSLDQALEWLSQFSDCGTNEIEAFIAQLERYSNRSQPKMTRRPELPWYSPSVLPVGQETDYFKKRQITPEAIERLDLRYCPTWQKYGYVGPCIIIPHYFGGELRGWQERWLAFPDTPQYIRKYMNSDDFPRDSTLYGWDHWDRTSGLVLVESALTVARLESIGIPAVASFGASLNSGQLRLLSCVPDIYVAYDNDEPGQKAAEILATNLDQHCNIWVVPPPKDEKADLGDLDDDEVHALLTQAQLCQLSGA